MPKDFCPEPAFEDSRLFLTATDRIELAESSIDETQPLYLITWTPNPKRLHFKYDMIKNHKWFRRTVFQQCGKCVNLLCMIPEFNLNGNIHYHGFFQLKDKVKWFKKALPCMKRIGFVKISKAEHYKVFDFRPEGNSLYYYKKEVCDNCEAYDYDYVVLYLPEEEVDAAEKRARNNLAIKVTVQSMFNQVMYDQAVDGKNQEEEIGYFLRMDNNRIRNNY